MKQLTLFLLLIYVIINNIEAHAYNEKHFARFFVNRSCHNCDLYKANFSGADLRNADFTGSNLILANFQDATLFGAILKNATISGANFSGAMWVDGSICKQGSYGRCIKRNKP